MFSAVLTVFLGFEMFLFFENVCEQNISKSILHISFISFSKGWHDAF